MVVVWLIFKTQPSAERHAAPNEPQISVQVVTLQPRDMPIRITSYGLVQPRVQSQLVAQVAGKIIYIAENAREGGFFEEGELLMAIEPDDYQVEVDIAQANLADARARYEEEEALAEVAEQDWKRSGNRGKAKALVLRKPQLAAAEAAVHSAKANLKRAQLNLKRTKIVAPYHGRSLSKNVDIGQVVGVNAKLGVIYADDAVEIRLPIKHSDLMFLQLPEVANISNKIDLLPKVMLRSSLNKNHRWQGKVVRTSGAIDENSRQLSVVARIEDPFNPVDVGKHPLKINQYVAAEIEGNIVKDAIVIPNKAIYQGAYVYLFTDGIVKRQDIHIVWQDSHAAVIHDGLKAGDQLVLTPIGQAVSGTPVKLANTVDKQSMVNKQNTQATERAGATP
ncbi:hypothetical protein AB835_14370 [Candidatus Endobugula sertula]|uniref:Efflux transporter periplasmic adaptor subunit n=1 Tax=Candidatus Endobugula sertula TaxID=62101 RepID=A0A1D2QLF6_9GAMM|nr:hypothetical protein AB835_14370 [Candidatus Endobugula sertula]